MKVLFFVLLIMSCGKERVVEQAPVQAQPTVVYGGHHHRHYPGCGHHSGHGGHHRLIGEIDASACEQFFDDYKTESYENCLKGFEGSSVDGGRQL
jgi:hypothetical protein